MTNHFDFPGCEDVAHGLGISIVVAARAPIREPLLLTMPMAWVRVAPATARRTEPLAPSSAFQQINRNINKNPKTSENNDLLRGANLSPSRLDTDADNESKELTQLRRRL